MTPVSRKQVEEGRRLNEEARRAPNPVETRDAQKQKRSSRSNRLARVEPFTGVEIVVPFKYCLSDNERVMIQRQQRRIVLRPEYRAAKDTIQHIARKAMNGAAPTEEAVEWRAVVHFPNNRRDLQNASKLLCDSCSGVVYRDDKQIKRASWEWAENDPENPRIVIHITPRSEAA